MSDLPAIPFSDIERMGRAIAVSKLFGVQSPEQAIALMLIAQAEGLHPAIAARDYNIIQGRPALKADAMLSRFQSAGGKVQWTELTDTRVSAIFTHPQGGSVEIDWTQERAKKAGLGEKEMWHKYPRQMLRARVISEGIRTVFPGAISGFYTPEEVQDMEPLPVYTESDLKAMEPEKGKTPEPKKAEFKEDDPLDAMRRDIAFMCYRVAGSEEAAADLLEKLTTWVDKDGKTVKGVRDPFRMKKEKNLQITHSKAQKLYTEWEATSAHTT